MAWLLRSAVNKAVEVGGRNSVSRAVRSYAGTVVNHAVGVGGSKLFQDSTGPRNFQNYKLAVKRLEEVSVSCKGIERVQLLRRWLVALKQIEILNEAISTDLPKPTVVLYYDPDTVGEPMDFRDVFLQSQALEGITLSLILEEPNQEELSLLQGIFRICLKGGKETLDVTVSSVQDLAIAFSTYNEEVLAKRAELLQFVQDAMAGLKVNAEIVRIDSEVLRIRKRLDAMKNEPVKESGISSEKSYEMSKELEVKEVNNMIFYIVKLVLQTEDVHKIQTQISDNNHGVSMLSSITELEPFTISKQFSVLGISLADNLFPLLRPNVMIICNGTMGDGQQGSVADHLNEALAHVRSCSRLVELLSRKKLIMQNEDSLAAHQEKVEKLKLLSESLASSASKAEKRILDNRLQKEEALKFRVTKDDEVIQIEKELKDEIKALQKRKDELEEELKQVAAALTSAQSRLHNAKEERDQFEQASNQIMQHFSVRDDELSKSIASYRAEAKVCNTFINFLESTWAFKTSSAVKKEKMVNDELERHDEYFMNWATSILEAIKDDMGPYISSFYELVEKLKRLCEVSSTEGKNDAVNLRKKLRKRYQTAESKMKTTFSLVERIKTQFSIRQNKDSSKSDGKVKELLDALDKMKHEYESIERPSLLPETPPRARIPGLPFLSRQVSKVQYSPKSGHENQAQSGMSLPFNPITVFPLVRSLSTKVPDMREVEHQDSFGGSRSRSRSRTLDAEAQLTKLKWELELEDHTVNNSMEGIIDWEFDEKFDKEPRKSI